MSDAVPPITLDEADRIATAVIRWGRDRDAGRLTVAVLDAGGKVIVLRRQGVIAGAVGVSGDTSEVDEAAAVAAIESTGLQADHGQVEGWRRP
jgi:uncharacterized protein GlcG (DUF336 family)